MGSVNFTLFRQNGRYHDFVGDETKDPIFTLEIRLLDTPCSTSLVV